MSTSSPVSAGQGEVVCRHEGAAAFVTLSNPSKLNAMSRAMWRQLREVFEILQDRPALRCVVVRGADGHFCAGGDIAEYPDFRFEEAGLRDFHENDVWGGLQAMLNCDVPIVAHIDGHCMGAGVEIASCCDIRLATDAARFGAPIAKLGFPMAPREAQLVARAVGDLSAREMLLGAAVLPACEMQRRGFLNAVMESDRLEGEVQAQVERMLLLGPKAARMNKQTLRALTQAPTAGAVEAMLPNAYAYADGSEHREGIAAFLEKRAPRF